MGLRRRRIVRSIIIGVFSVLLAFLLLAPPA